MKISVITVCYNSAETIGHTLSSVKAQAYGEVEHIIVDGLSTDNTLGVIAEFGKHIAKLVCEKDNGIFDAMNKGLKLASGEIIGFLNSDDVYADSEVLSRVARAFEDPGVEACFGDLVYVTKDNKKIVRYWKSGLYKAGSFARGWCPAHPTFYIRRSALERLGYFDTKYRLAADAEFMMRYLECGGIRSVYIPYIQVRMRIGGASNQSVASIVSQNQEVLHALRKNKIPYSFISFLVNKVISRIWQRITAFFTDFLIRD